MTRRNPVGVPILCDFELRQRSDNGAAQHAFSPIAHRAIGKKFGARIGRNSWFLRWLRSFSSKCEMTCFNAFCGQRCSDAIQGGLQSLKVLAVHRDFCRRWMLTYRFDFRFLAAVFIAVFSAIRNLALVRLVAAFKSLG